MVIRFSYLFVVRTAIAFNMAVAECALCMLFRSLFGDTMVRSMYSPPFFTCTRTWTDAWVYLSAL
eukprot:m.1647978 g.1647978  ORF g.1647978 m.1647978 type:complete len:65 (+) comp77238_c0_seq1:150-344(+)